MTSYDLVTPGKFGKMVGSFLALCRRIWLFSGLHLAPWKKVDLATLMWTTSFAKKQFYVTHVSNQNALVRRRWKSYKRNVPTYGAILLDSNLEYVLLVQGYWVKASWGFPKGKVNESESAESCAAREVLEETGFDISAMIDKCHFAETHMNEQLTRLYFVRDVPMSAKFQPRTRGEIKNVQWFHVNDLPAHKKDPTPKQNLNLAANNFFMVLPFVKQMRRWIAAQKQSAPSTPTSKASSASKPANAETNRAGPKAPAAAGAPPVDKALRDQFVQSFGQGNNRELEAITSTFGTNPPLLERSPRQQRRRSRGGGQLPRAANQLQGLAAKGRGRGYLADFVPEAWKNFTFDKEKLLKAIAGFNRQNGWNY